MVTRYVAPARCVASEVMVSKRNGIELVKSDSTTMDSMHAFKDTFDQQVNMEEQTIPS